MLSYAVLRRAPVINACDQDSYTLLSGPGDRHGVWCTVQAR